MKSISTFLKKLLLATSLAATAAWSQGANGVAPAPTAWPTSGWQESTPEQQGIASDAVRRVVEFGAISDMDSLLMVRHGKLVVDAYYAPYHAGMKHLINSATKGVTATLTGIAIKDGLLKSTQQPVMDFFPARRTAKPDTKQQAITLEHLLDMTSGIDWKEPLGGLPESMFQMGRSPDWTAFILDRPMAHPPGTAFNYNSGNSQLLSNVLTQATGGSAEAFARKRLFGPLGISDVQWQKDPQGHSTGGFGLYMHPRDMAKIGYLYLHNGAWQDQQLLPPQWTDKVFHPVVDMGMGTTPAFRYANGWWSIPERNVFMAVGYHRQLIMVLPKLDMVVVTTGRTHYRFDALIDLIEASSLANQALPTNPAAYAELGHRVKDVATEKASPVGASSALAPTIGGRVYQFENNQLGLSSMQLDLTPANPHYELLFKATNTMVGARRMTGPIGLAGLFLSTESNNHPTYAVKANWTDASTLAMVSRAVADGITSTYSLRFNGDKVDISYQDNSGFSALLHGTFKP
jgi:CubicO group peptidase (beta-lactamase class C family)